MPRLSAAGRARGLGRGRVLADCSPQIAKPAAPSALASTHPPCSTEVAEGRVRGTLQGMPRSVARGMPLYGFVLDRGRNHMEDRTDIIETTPTPNRREVNRVPRTTTEYRSVERPAADVDRVKSGRYDPYASRRLAGLRTVQLVYWVF